MADTFFQEVETIFSSERQRTNTEPAEYRSCLDPYYNEQSYIYDHLNFPSKNQSWVPEQHAKLLPGQS